MNAEELLDLIKDLIQSMKDDCPVFGVLVVGETGSGKSTLINNLLGKDVVPVGSTLESSTTTVVKYEVDVDGVPVALYDTPGLGDSRGCKKDMNHLCQMKGILKRGYIRLVIYCLKLSETRMRDSLICMFEEYSKIGVKWEQSLIALTFADNIPLSKKDKEKPGFEMGNFFNQRVAEMQKYVTKGLMERVGVAQEVAKKVKCHPTTSDTKEKLWNGEQWFVPLWLDVLDILSPGAAVRFLEIHANNMANIDLQPKDESRIKDILLNKFTMAAAGVGVGTGFSAAIGAFFGGPVGAILGATIGGMVTGAGAFAVSNYMKGFQEKEN